MITAMNSIQPTVKVIVNSNVVKFTKLASFMLPT